MGKVKTSQSGVSQHDSRKLLVDGDFTLDVDDDLDILESSNESSVRVRLDPGIGDYVGTDRTGERSINSRDLTSGKNNTSPTKLTIPG